MAKDPAFLFYPGDYLRDTQCLSEKTQVAYDRIMCEHMRNTSVDMNNIVVSKDKVTFFTKRLSEEERQELFTVLIKKGDEYQIEWVAESIADRRLYSESRSKNRLKKEQTHEIISKHMEDEDENKDNNLKKVFNTMPVVSDFNGLPEQYITSAKELVFRLNNKIEISDDTVIALWDSFKIQNLTGDNYYPNKGKVYSHFINVIKKEKFNTDGGTKNNTGSGKSGNQSDKRAEANRNY